MMIEMMTYVYVYYFNVIQYALIILYELCSHPYCVVVCLWCLYSLGTDTQDEEL